MSSFNLLGNNIWTQRSLKVTFHLQTLFNTFYCFLFMYRTLYITSIIIEIFPSFFYTDFSRHIFSLFFPAIFFHNFFPLYFYVIFSGVLEVSGEDTKYKMLMRGNEHPWYENIKITCKECDNQFWLGQFMKHIILNHKMPIKVSGLFRFNSLDAISSIYLYKIILLFYYFDESYKVWTLIKRQAFALRLKSN